MEKEHYQKQTDVHVLAESVMNIWNNNRDLCNVMNHVWQGLGNVLALIVEVDTIPMDLKQYTVHTVENNAYVPLVLHPMHTSTDQPKSSWLFSSQEFPMPPLQFHWQIPTIAW